MTKPVSAAEYLEAVDFLVADARRRRLKREGLVLLRIEELEALKADAAKFKAIKRKMPRMMSVLAP